MLTWLFLAVYVSVKMEYLATDMYKTDLSYLYIDFLVSYVNVSYSKRYVNVVPVFN